VKIEVVNPGNANEGFGPIPVERTNVAGLAHKKDVISMARGQPDITTSGWFICINDQPSLDFGGSRNPDGQASLRSGRVVRGMDGVRNPMAPNTNTEAQLLTPPIKILKASRQSKRTHRPPDDAVNSRIALARRQSSSRIDQRT
jgi:peptidyl-prolyl cis-trans isomerase A (cyclophilin A)